MSFESGRIALGRLVLVLLIVGSLVAATMGALSRSSSSASTLEGVPVRRGPLRISVTASGGLNAAETVRMTSGVEGRTTILSIAPEGTQVREGELVCELDATAMAEQRIQQAITHGNAAASAVKARQTLEIQASQNRSDIKKAKQTIEFAGQDLQMFLEGERHIELEKAQQAIDLAHEDEQRAGNQLSWSEKLNAKGFLTAAELETDRIALHRAQVQLVQAKQSLKLLETFKMPRREAELRAAVEEAQQEGERVALQAQAHLVDFESDVRTCEAALALEQQKLARLDAQIQMAKIRAPRDGYVVYAQRDRDEPPIQAGAEVREREEILSIPSSGGMVAAIKLHESVLQQVHADQHCDVRIDALPGIVLNGKITFVAMLPDQTSRWSNPNVRLYRTDVAIMTANHAMRPGMSCAVEILIEEIADAIYVPVQAVHREGDRTISFVKHADELERREVRVGSFNELWVQVLEGLREGEIVMMSKPAGHDARASAIEPAGKEAKTAN